MKKILFKKFSGAGNDFVLIDERENKNIDISENLIYNLCNRQTGIGADGLLYISDDNSTDFNLKYYNSDGKIGSLCGNGSRCAIKYAQMSGRISDVCTFSWNSVLYKGLNLEDDQVCFYMKDPEDLQLGLSVEIFKQVVKGDFVNTGSPHFVIEVKEIDPVIQSLENLDVFNWGTALRHHDQFLPAGTNVNFIKIEDAVMYIRTFERGVENETLACGTGSVASAIVSVLNNKIIVPVKIIPKSGEKLIVDFKLAEGKITGVTLTGPAKLVFQGEYYI